MAIGYDEATPFMNVAGFVAPNRYKDWFTDEDFAKTGQYYGADWSKMTDSVRKVANNLAMSRLDIWGRPMGDKYQGPIDQSTYRTYGEAELPSVYGNAWTADLGRNTTIRDLAARGYMVDPAALRDPAVLNALNVQSGLPSQYLRPIDPSSVQTISADQIKAQQAAYVPPEAQTGAGWNADNISEFYGKAWDYMSPAEQILSKQYALTGMNLNGVILPNRSSWDASMAPQTATPSGPQTAASARALDKEINAEIHSNQSFVNGVRTNLVKMALPDVSGLKYWNNLDGSINFDTLSAIYGGSAPSKPAWYDAYVSQWKELTSAPMPDELSLGTLAHYSSVRPTIPDLLKTPDTTPIAVKTGAVTAAPVQSAPIAPAPLPQEVQDQIAQGWQGLVTNYYENAPIAATPMDQLTGSRGKFALNGAYRGDGVNWDNYGQQGEHRFFDNGYTDILAPDHLSALMNNVQARTPTDAASPTMSPAIMNAGPTLAGLPSGADMLPYNGVWTDNGFIPNADVDSGRVSFADWIPQFLTSGATTDPTSNFAGTAAGVLGTLVGGTPAGLAASILGGAVDGKGWDRILGGTAGSVIGGLLGGPLGALAGNGLGQSGVKVANVNTALTNAGGDSLGVLGSIGATIQDALGIKDASASGASSAYNQGIGNGPYQVLDNPQVTDPFNVSYPGTVQVSPIDAGVPDIGGIGDLGGMPNVGGIGGGWGAPLAPIDFSMGSLGDLGGFSTGLGVGGFW